MSCRQISLARILWGSAPYSAHCSRRIYGALPQTPPSRFSFGEKRGKRTYISFFTLSFRAGVYGTKTGMDLRKIYLPFSIARLRKLQRLTAAKRRKNNILPQSVPLTPFARRQCAAPNFAGEQTKMANLIFRENMPVCAA